MRNLVPSLAFAGLTALLPAMAFAEAPVVTTNPYVARGATFALGRLSYDGSVKKSGFCYSKTNTNPTIEDNITSKRYSNNGIIHKIENLEPSTFYYVRAYATNADGETGYGDVVRILTIPMGTIDATYSGEGQSDDDIDARIQSAIDGALDAWNNSTSIHDYHPSVHYSPGTQTADCSYGGWIRMGANTSYQRTGTLLHEMNHGVGVGQHSIWYGPDSPYRVNGTTGLWKGKRANAIVQFLENDPTESLHGDSTHMWPYGINGASEDTGAELLYLANGLITQALGEDALPPVKDQFHTGSFNFECVDGVKYYIKNELEENNRSAYYLYEGDANALVWGPMSSEAARSDDRAAWYLAYDPVELVYTFKNAATGNYISWIKTTNIGTASPETLTEREKFVLTESIDDVTLEGATLPTYWISCIADKRHEARSLSLKEGEVKCRLWEVADTGNQRWFIFPAESMDYFSSTAVNEISMTPKATFPGDVYDIAGRRIKANAENLDGLQKGIYIVNGKKFVVK